MNIYKLIFSVFILIISLKLNSQTIDTVKSVDAIKILETENSNMIIIDGRDSIMFNSGHIKNAVNLNAFSPDIEVLLTPYLIYDTLFIYCSNQRRSESIINNLIKLNYNKHIIYMSDGINGWKSNGFNVEVDNYE